ncbi:MAG: hypothetical protein AAF192_21725 [Pseudomonadota bacterium]
MFKRIIASILANAIFAAAPTATKAAADIVAAIAPAGPTLPASTRRGVPQRRAAPAPGCAYSRAGLSTREAPALNPAA